MIAFIGIGPSKLIGMKLSDAKKLFFDVPAIAKAFDKAQRRVFAQFGGYVRSTARRSIRPVGKKLRSAAAAILLELRSPAARFNPLHRAHLEAKLEVARQAMSSQPGKPPHSIQGALRNNIYFCADMNRRSVVIGPTLINKPTGAPRTLEEGGTAVIVSTRGGRQTRRRVKIAARPFMVPAFRKSKPALSRMWRDSLRK